MTAVSQFAIGRNLAALSNICFQSAFSFSNILRVSYSERVIVSLGVLP